MMLMHFDILAHWDLMTHISTLYCMQPTQTDRFQLPTYNFYVQVMTPHKVVSLISFYKDIEEEQETGSTWIYVDLRHLSELCPSSVALSDTSEALLHVMRDITAMCDVTNSCHRHCAGELVREGRQRREDPPCDEELGITSRRWSQHHGVSMCMICAFPFVSILICVFYHILFFL